MSLPTPAKKRESTKLITREQSACPSSSSHIPHHGCTKDNRYTDGRVCKNEQRIEIKPKSPKKTKLTQTLARTTCWTQRERERRLLSPQPARNRSPEQKESSRTPNEKQTHPTSSPPCLAVTNH